MIAALALLAAVSAGAQTAESVDVSALARTAAAANAPAVVVDKDATGAWYRKISSVESPRFDGIATTGILPTPTFDPARMHVPGPGEGAYTSGPLDSPSVYVGLHTARAELDAGLKWDHVYDSAGQPVGAYAWRVFWRVRNDATSTWHNPVPGSVDDVYMLPGDDFVMTLTTGDDGQARLEIRGGGRDFATTIALAGLSDGGKPLPRSFKRVHSIDQFREAGGARVGNEGGTATPTRTRLTGGRWTTTDLLVASGRTPLVGGLAVDVRGADEADVYAAVFPGAGLDAHGGEAIDILPPAPPAP